MGWSRPKVTTYWPSCISNVTRSAHAHRAVLASLLQGAESLARTLPLQRIDHPGDQGSLILYAPHESCSCLPRCQNNQVRRAWRVMKEY